MAEKALCKIDGCGKPVKARGWCASHYQRWRARGDPLAGGKFRPKPGEALQWLSGIAVRQHGNECLFWPFAKGAAGYGYVTISGKGRLVHRLVCAATHGGPPTMKHEAAHLCGNGHKGCVNPTHLIWKTRAENDADKILHGTTNRGERAPTAKLSEGDVLEIRGLSGAVTQSALAERFGVSQGTISEIQNRKKWVWLK